MIIKKSLINILLYSIILGVIYPAVLTSLGQLIYFKKANGSIIELGGKKIGSSLLGQSFLQEKYFWPRPSAINYNPSSSSGSNLAISNPTLFDNIKNSINKYKVNNNSKIPVDLVTTSASGLDPDISLDAAIYQIPRIAKARSIREEELISLVNRVTINDLFGKKRINVLLINLMLDKNEY